MTADLGIVVVTYQSEQVVAALLESIPNALGPVDADVVVVDNGSSDNTVAVAQRSAVGRVVRSSNTGYAGGVNVGVRQLAPGVPVLVLNPDITLAPGSVPTMLAALEIPGTGVVAPRVSNRDGSLNRSLRREPTVRRTLGLTRTRLPVFSEYLDRPADYDSPREVDWALGAALLIDRRCFDALGGFDESFFLYSEETDFCLRARDIGYATRFEPAADVMHIGGQSGQSGRIYTMQVINRLRLYGRRHGRVLGWLYFGVLLLNECTRIPRRNGRWSRAAVHAMVQPSRRPSELRCGTRLMPD